MVKSLNLFPFLNISTQYLLLLNLDFDHVISLISYGLFPVYRWGNTPLDEARIGGNKDLIKLLEVARASQIG